MDLFSSGTFSHFGVIRTGQIVGDYIISTWQRNLFRHCLISVYGEYWELEQSIQNLCHFKSYYIIVWIFIVRKEMKIRSENWRISRLQVMHYVYKFGICLKFYSYKTTKSNLRFITIAIVMTNKLSRRDSTFL